MTLRVLAAALGAAVGLAAAAPTAGATDFFATTDNTKTTQDCLTEATACALGRAMDVIPNVPGTQQAVGVHTLTLLAGAYDTADFDAGAPFAALGRLDVKRGLTVQGAPGNPAPTIDVSAGPPTDVGIEMDQGGILRHLSVVRNSAGGAVRVGGFAAQFGNPGVVGTLDRVAVSVSAPGTTGFSIAVVLMDFGVVKNSLLDQAGGDPAQGSAISVSPFTAEGTPSIIGSTLRAAGAALAVGGSPSSVPTTVNVSNTVMRGTPDVDAAAVVGSPVAVTLTNSAWRNAAPNTTASGPVTIDAKTPALDADPRLDGGGKPLEGSPLIDAGAPLAELGPLDLDGNARVQGSAPDIGAYEVASSAPGGGGAGGGTQPPGAPLPPQCGCLPPATPPAPDTRAPAVTSLKPPKTLKRSKLSKGKGATLVATLDEAVASAKLELLQITKKKGKKPKEKVLGSATLGAGGPTLTFALKVKGSRLGKKGKLKLTLRFTFVDAAGNKTVADKPVTVS